MRWFMPLAFFAVALAFYTFIPEGWGDRDGLVLVVGLLGLMILLSDMIEISFGRIFNPMSHLWCFVIAPGTILHELGHYVACLLTGLEVTKVKLFQPNPKTRQLGYVNFKMPGGPARWSVIQGMIVAMAPFVSGTLALLGLLYLLQPSLALPEVRLDSLSVVQDDFIRLYEDLSEGFSASSERLGAWRFLILYGILVVGSGVAPSTEDFMVPLRQSARRWTGAVFGLAFILGLGVLFLFIPTVTKLLVSVLALAVICQLFSFSVSLGIRAITSVLPNPLGKKKADAAT